MRPRGPAASKGAWPFSLRRGPAPTPPPRTRAAALGRRDRRAGADLPRAPASLVRPEGQRGEGLALRERLRLRPCAPRPPPPLGAPAPRPAKGASTPHAGAVFPENFWSVAGRADASDLRAPPLRPQPPPARSPATLAGLGRQRGPDPEGPRKTPFLAFRPGRGPETFTSQAEASRRTGLII